MEVRSRAREALAGVHVLEHLPGDATTREEAEGYARNVSEMFIARYENKPGGPVRRLLPVREMK